MQTHLAAPIIDWQPRVVWFDDNLHLVQPAQDGLRQAGLDVTPFANPDDMRTAMVALSREKPQRLPDVVITDLVIDESSNYADEDGVSLAEFTAGLYTQRARVCARLGVASGYPQQIAAAQGTHRVDFSFYYCTDEIINGRFGLFLRDVVVSASRLRRDLWCREYERAYPFEFDDLGGRVNWKVRFGAVMGLDAECARICTWDLADLRAERTERVERRVFEQAGAFAVGEPFRLVEYWYPAGKPSLKGGVSVHKLRGLGRSTFFPIGGAPSSRVISRRRPK